MTLDTLKLYVQEEVANVWRLWKAGIVRENCARADVPGVVIVFECASVEEVKSYVEEFPLSKRGFLDWRYIALDAPLPLEYLFDSAIDTGEPYDRRHRAEHRLAGLRRGRKRGNCIAKGNRPSPQSGDFGPFDAGHERP